MEQIAEDQAVHVLAGKPADGVGLCGVNPFAEAAGDFAVSLTGMTI